MLSRTVTGRRNQLPLPHYCRYFFGALVPTSKEELTSTFPTMRSIVVATILLAGGALADTPAQRAAALLAQMNITEKVRVVPVGGACLLGLGPAAAPASRTSTFLCPVPFPLPTGQWWGVDSAVAPWRPRYTPGSLWICHMQEVADAAVAQVPARAPSVHDVCALGLVGCAAACWFCVFPFPLDHDGARRQWTLRGACPD